MPRIIVWYVAFLLTIVSGVAVAESPPAPRGELRIVDMRPANRFSITMNVYEPLMSLTPDGTLVPELASAWRWRDDRTLEVTLRQGVTFHNGEVLDAEIVRLNWEAFRDFREYYGPDLVWWFFPSETRLEILTPHTLLFVFPASDAALTLRLSHLWIANRQFFKYLDQRVQERQQPRGAILISSLREPGPWGTGPYQLMQGTSHTTKQADQIVLEAHQGYWDKSRLPRVQRLIFDHTLTSKEALEHVMSSDGQVDLFVGMRPLDTLKIAQSPFAKVVKERSSLTTVLGLFNIRKAASPWRDPRLRQAMNFALNREDFLRYAVKGNGVLTPALLSPGVSGFDATLPPYPFDPAAARRLLLEAGYPDGLPIMLIAQQELEVQATVVGKMLEQMGCTVQLQLLDRAAFFRATSLYAFLFPGGRRQEPAWPTWDIALTETAAWRYPVPLLSYYDFVFGGHFDWVDEDPALHDLLEQLLRTSDHAQQQAMVAQMERHTHAQAYFLSVYAPIQLYAVNKEVNFEPHPVGLHLEETVVTEQHWSIRQQKMETQR